MSHQDLNARPKSRPVFIAQGALGNSRKMLVSPQHGMVLSTAASGDRLVRAIHLAKSGGHGFRVAHGIKEVTYVHLMFAEHQVIYAENAPSESFYPGPMGLAALNPTHRTAVFRAFPELILGAAGLEAYGPTALPFLQKSKLDHQVARSFQNDLCTSI